MPQRFFTGSQLEEQSGPNNTLPTAAATLSGVGGKRVGHGSMAWSMPLAEDAVCQPQDGAIESRESRELRKRAATSGGVQEIHARLPRLANEPEDARLTGGTRSLMRRLMGLNVTARPGVRRPARGAATVPTQQVA